MSSGDGGVTRRALLVATPLLAAAVACHDDGKAPSSGPGAGPAETPTADADRLAAAVAAERLILAHHDAYVTASDGLVDPQRETRAMHVQHLQALGAQNSLHGARRPSHPLGPRDLLDELRRSATRLDAFALRAESGDLAALLASIGASHAALAELGRW